MSDVTMYDIVAEVRKVAKENPTFVYVRQFTNSVSAPLCKYQEADGCDGCIFGHVFSRLGLMDKLLNQFPQQRASILVVLQDLGLIQTSEDRTMARWCEDVQSSQDSGIPWADAVQRADHTYPSVR